MAETRASVQRPLSPHIQVYKWTLPFLMSGFHRVTGFVLYFGFVLVAWWLIAAATSPAACDRPPDAATAAVLGGLALTGNAPKRPAAMLPAPTPRKSRPTSS